MTHQCARALVSQPAQLTSVLTVYDKPEACVGGLAVQRLFAFNAVLVVYDQPASGPIYDSFPYLPITKQANDLVHLLIVCLT